MDGAAVSVTENQAALASWVIGIILQNLPSKDSSLDVGEGDVLGIALLFRMITDFVVARPKFFSYCLDVHCTILQRELIVTQFMGLVSAPGGLVDIRR